MTWVVSQTLLIIKDNNAYREMQYIVLQRNVLFETYVTVLKAIWTTKKLFLFQSSLLQWRKHFKTRDRLCWPQRYETYHHLISVRHWLTAWSWSQPAVLCFVLRDWLILLSRIDYTQSIILVSEMIKNGKILYLPDHLLLPAAFSTTLQYIYTAISHSGT